VPCRALLQSPSDRPIPLHPLESKTPQKRIPANRTEEHGAICPTDAGLARSKHSCHRQPDHFGCPGVAQSSSGWKHLRDRDSRKSFSAGCHFLSSVRPFRPLASAVSATGLGCFSHWPRLFQPLASAVSATGLGCFSHWPRLFQPLASAVSAAGPVVSSRSIHAPDPRIAPISATLTNPKTLGERSNSV
jgi:hypothetical protein